MLLCVPAASVSAAEACSNYGINSHLPSPTDLDKIKAAGFHWIRVDFNWWAMEPSNNNFQWGQTDPVVNKAHEMGLNIFATLSYTPQWAAADQNCQNGAGEDGGCNPKPFASVAEWQNYVSTVVTRYKGKITHWGMWNEPNLSHFYSGTEDQYVYDILIPGAQAAEGADPAAVILGPELAGLGKSDHWNGDEGICSDNDPWPQFEKQFYHDFHDGVFNNELWSFGIVDTEGNPKPAYNALQQYFAANPPDCDDGPDPPPGEAPTISGIPDVLLVQGKSKPYAVDLLTFSSDPDTTDAQLIFSVKQQDPGNLNASIQDGRYLALIPQGNWTGSGTVTAGISAPT